jgi:hypothetical protein
VALDDSSGGFAVPLRRITAYDVGLAFSLIFPSTAIFNKGQYALLAAYIVVACAALWLATRHVLPWLNRKLPQRWASVVVLVALLGGTAVAREIVHPRIDTTGFRIAGMRIGASDNDDAIDAALKELSAGRYPYYVKTFLGHPLSPLPGALLLAWPFYLLGDSARQNIFWLAVFFIAVGWRRGHRFAAMAAALVVFLSPNVFYQQMQGMDYAANAIYVGLFAVLLVHGAGRRGVSLGTVAAAIMFGIALSSRLNFLLLVPFTASALVRATNLRTAAILCAIVASAFVACTAPFYFYDPAGFSPLHTLGKINGDGRLPAASIAVPALAVLSSAWLVWRRRRSNYSLAAAARDAFAVMALLVVCATIIDSRLARFTPMHFGTLFLFYGVIGFWPPWLYSRDP